MFAIGLHLIELIAAHQPYLAVRYFMPSAALTISAALIDRLNSERDRLQRENDDWSPGLTRWPAPTRWPATYRVRA